MKNTSQNGALINAADKRKGATSKSPGYSLTSYVTL